MLVLYFLKIPIMSMFDLSQIIIKHSVFCKLNNARKISFM